MLISINEIASKYKLKLNGIIHVGAHYAEEHNEYERCGISKFAYIEPCADAFKVMVERFNNTDSGNILLFNVACGANEEDMVMHVSHNNEGQSNSLLEPNLHLQQHPEVQFTDAEVVKVVKLDSLPIDFGQYDILAMDVQGFEGEVLKGASKALQNVKVVYSEVNRGQTYAGNMEIDEMDEFLKQFGFERVETFWPSPNWTWGDAIYIKR